MTDRPHGRAARPGQLLRRGLDALLAYDRLDLAATFTIVLMLHHAALDGSAMHRAALFVVLPLAVLLPRLRRSAVYWGGVTVLVGLSVVQQWYLKDNHGYLTLYWLLALTLAFASPDPRRFLAFNGRFLIGLCFAAAVIAKAVAPDFLDGRFFHSAMLFDARMDRVVRLMTDASMGELRELREAFRTHLSYGVAEGGFAVPIRADVALVAKGITWWVMAVESAVAVAFLVPARTWLGRHRDLVLLAFIFSTYILIPVIGFGWLLLAMGVSQVDQQRWRWMTACYVAAFVILLVVRHVFIGGPALLL